MADKPKKNISWGEITVYDEHGEQVEALCLSEIDDNSDIEEYMFRLDIDTPLPDNKKICCNEEVKNMIKGICFLLVFLGLAMVLGIFGKG